MKLGALVAGIALFAATPATGVAHAQPPAYIVAGDVTSDVVISDAIVIVAGEVHIARGGTLKLQRDRVYGLRGASISVDGSLAILGSDDQSSSVAAGSSFPIEVGVSGNAVLRFVETTGVSLSVSGTA